MSAHRTQLKHGQRGKIEEDYMNISFSDAVNATVAGIAAAALRVLIAFLLLFVFFKLIGILFRNLEKKLLSRKSLDATVVKSLLHFGRIAAKCLVIIALVGFLGFDTSVFSTLVASLGVCVGLAVNGTLSNLAGGIMLLMTRPFSDGDFIEALGYSGTVEEIRIVSTRICTPDNKIIYIPNGSLSTSSIVNYSIKDIRRVDFVFSIAYSDDFERAKKLIADICENHALVLKDPAPFIRVACHNESSVDITTRVWVKNADYWTVNFDILEAVKHSFDENGIEIPFKQVDVHVKQDA